jgi:hypothetical protein
MRSKLGDLQELKKVKKLPLILDIALPYRLCVVNILCSINCSTTPAPTCMSLLNSSKFVILLALVLVLVISLTYYLAIARLLRLAF